MITLNVYDSIEIGDTITLPNSFLATRSGVVFAIRKWNGNAKRITCTNGAEFELNRYSHNFVLTVEDNN